VPSIDGSRAKWRRAKEHFDALDELVRAFFKNDSHSVSVESHPERGYYAFRLRNPRPIPYETWSLLIGDCVHNMRAALDYIAWELAGARHDDRRTMFPIYDDPAKFKKHGEERIKKLPVAAQELIRGIQPYTSPPVNKHPLWAIETLDASDKHKLLTLTVARPTEADFIIWTPDDDPISLYKVRVSDLAGVVDFKEDAIFAEVRVTPPCPQMKVTPRPMPFDLAFDWDLGLGIRQFVAPGLRKLLSELNLVVELFDQRFFRK
jgi:hypothetical protein